MDIEHMSLPELSKVLDETLSDETLSMGDKMKHADRIGRRLYQLRNDVYGWDNWAKDNLGEHDE